MMAAPTVVPTVGPVVVVRVYLTRQKKRWGHVHLGAHQTLRFRCYYRLALEKDPEYVRALILMGQTLLQKQWNADATEYFERAITKLFIAGHPTEVEDFDNLILASQWAGVAHIRQGKIVEGIVHLERIAQLEEPDEPKSKAHYFDGLLMLASALSNVGRKDEALKHLRLAAAYNPAYNEYLEQCENEDDSVVSGKRKIQQERKRLGNKKKDKKKKS